MHHLIGRSDMRGSETIGFHGFGVGKQVISQFQPWSFGATTAGLFHSHMCTVSTLAGLTIPVVQIADARSAGIHSERPRYEGEGGGETCLSSLFYSEFLINLLEDWEHQHAKF